MTWEAALCRDSDPDAWFPGVNESPDNIRTVKRICGRCDAAAECLASAVENREEYGIWAGLEPRQLRKLWKDAS